MIFKVIIFLLPAVALCEITVNIVQGQTPEFFGDITDVISDAERRTFRINDDELKNAVDKYIQGRPSDVYVRSPTPWDDLYKRFGWSEVRRTLRVRSARILGVNTQPTIIGRKNFHNGSPQPAVVTGFITQMEDNTITHKWTKSGSISVGQKINYNMKLGAGSVGGTTSFSFKSTFGEESVETISTKVGSKSKVEIRLEGGQSAVAVLTASKGTMDVEVEYEASVGGSVANHYAGKLKGHYFWSFDINRVLEAAGLPRTVVWKETMHVGFYSDESITAYDGSGNAIAKSKAVY